MVSLQELSRLVGGNLTGHPDLMITGAASISRASAEDITFACSAGHLQEFLDSQAAAGIVPIGTGNTDKPCIEVDDVEAAFVIVARYFKPPVDRPKIGISPRAIVAESARIAAGVCIHPGAVVMDDVVIGPGTVVFPNVTIMEGSVIGADVKVFPNVTIYEKTIVGDRVIIHAGAVLGAYGFGYKSIEGKHQLSAQLGNVVIGDDAEIGANTTIDRGTYDSTTIGAGTKLDNLVMVGHNCSIGDHNLLCSQVGIAGSCQTGSYVVMGGQVGLADHLTIGDQVSIGAKSGLMHDIESRQRYFGIPARPAREEMQILANRARLPEMRRAIKQLQKQVEQIQSSDPVEQENASSSSTKAA